MTTPNNDNQEVKKGEHCTDGSCGKGGCGMKLCSPCGMLKIAMLVVIIAYAVNYFMK